MPLVLGRANETRSHATLATWRPLADAEGPVGKHALGAGFAAEGRRALGDKTRVAGQQKRCDKEVHPKH